jgi:hypothetical protein
MRKISKILRSPITSGVKGGGANSPAGEGLGTGESLIPATGEKLRNSAYSVLLRIF